MFDVLFLGGTFFVFAISLASLLLTIYVIYDIVFVQDFETVEKLIWIIIVLFLNIIGVFAYLLIVKYLEEDPFASFRSYYGEDRRLGELERLSALKEQGALSEEEYREEKRRILDQE